MTDPTIGYGVQHSDDRKPSGLHNILFGFVTPDRTLGKEAV